MTTETLEVIEQCRSLLERAVQKTHETKGATREFWLGRSDSVRQVLEMLEDEEERLA